MFVFGEKLLRAYVIYYVCTESK